MTDVQLYLAIGIPTLAVLLGILTNAIQWNAINARFNSVETRIGSVDTRISSLETRIDGRFNNLDVRFDTLTGKVIDVLNRVTRIEAKLRIS